MRLMLGLRFNALAAATIGAALAATQAFAQSSTPSPATDDVVYCHERGVVQPVMAGNCGGEIISRAEADKIKADAIERRRRMLANPRKPVISGHKLRSIGTGFFVTADGKLLTNHHVVDGCSALSVETPGGVKTEATLLDSRPEDDLALLASGLEAPAVATFLAENTLAAGTPISLIGYPDQGLAPIKPLLTHGELGEGLRFASSRARFEIRADVRHGNSGGPVVDRRGLVIGVVFAKVNSVAVFQKTGQSVRFIGAVIDNGAVFSFLDRNGLRHRTATSGSMIDDDAIGEMLRPIVARIGCWK